MKILNRQTLFESHDRDRALLKKSVWGGVSTLVAQGVRMVLTMGSTAILARLLTPSDYGLFGMVIVIVSFAQMFKEAGLSMATVQKANISHNQISTLFWVNIFISVGLGLCILAGAPLVAAFYGKSELTAVTAALSISFVLGGLAIQHKALLRRHMRFGTLAGVQIANQIVSLAVTISLALLGWKYWALVGGALILALSDVLLTFFFCRWIPGRIRKGTGAREMLLFGGHLTGFNFVNYFSRNADKILIGKFIGIDAVGIYTKAYQLFLMPIAQIRAPITQVAMPVLSSLKDQPGRYVKYYQRIVDIMATLIVPLTLYCVIEADFIIGLLLGSQWDATIPVFRILAIAGLVQAVAGTRGMVLTSCGLSKRYFYWGLINAVVTVLSFGAGIPFGVEGVASAYAVANYLLLIPSLFYCFHETPVTVRVFMKTLIAPLVSAGVAAGCVFFMKKIWVGNSFWLSGLRLAVFAAIYGGLSFSRKSIRETGALIFKGIVKKSD